MAVLTQFKRVQPANISWHCHTDTSSHTSSRLLSPVAEIRGQTPFVRTKFFDRVTPMACQEMGFSYGGALPISYSMQDIGLSTDYDYKGGRH